MKSQHATADRFATNVYDAPVLSATHSMPPALAAADDSGLMITGGAFQDARSKSFTVVSVSTSIPNQGSGN